jgi:hypothetical protein
MRRPALWFLEEALSSRMRTDNNTQVDRVPENAPRRVGAGGLRDAGADPGHPVKGPGFGKNRRCCGMFQVDDAATKVPRRDASRLASRLLIGPIIESGALGRGP